MFRYSRPLLVLRCESRQQVVQLKLKMKSSVVSYLTVFRTTNVQIPRHLGKKRVKKPCLNKTLNVQMACRHTENYEKLQYKTRIYGNQTPYESQKAKVITLSTKYKLRKYS